MDNNISSSSSSKSGMVTWNQKRESERIRFGNPFTLKVGQVFTGFGIGCGIGIGVGRPLNLGIYPSPLSLSNPLSLYIYLYILVLVSLLNMDFGKLFKSKKKETHWNPEANKPCTSIFSPFLSLYFAFY